MVLLLPGSQVSNGDAGGHVLGILTFSIWGASGFILSPTLFNIYMKLQWEIIQRFGVGYHQYANDTIFLYHSRQQPGNCGSPGGARDMDENQ